MKNLRVSLVCTALIAACSSGPQIRSAAEAATPQCDYGTAHPSMPEEFSQFAFLIGDYDITSHAWTPQGWSPPRPGPQAQWNGRYGLGGMAIYDEWFDPNPESDPNAPRGVNVRYYDAKSNEWKMMWVHTSVATVQDLRAEMRDGVLTMWQVYPERPNFKAEFIVEDADHWHRLHYVKDETGNWILKFKLAATRIPCEAEG